MGQEKETKYVHSLPLTLYFPLKLLFHTNDYVKESVLMANVQHPKCNAHM